LLATLSAARYEFEEFWNIAPRLQHQRAFDFIILPAV
jgi:hypothetical protein